MLKNTYTEPANVSLLHPQTPPFKTSQTFLKNMHWNKKHCPELMFFLDVPVVLGLETQLTDRKDRRRRKATGSLLSGFSMLALLANLLGTVSLIQQRWGAGAFHCKRVPLFPPLSTHPPSSNLVLRLKKRKRNREGKRWEKDAGRLDVERRKHYIMPLSPPLKSKCSADNPPSVSW